MGTSGGRMMTLSRSNLSRPDHYVMRRLNRWNAPRWVRWWMLASTRGGDGWFWAFCGIALLANHNRSSLFAFLAAAVAACSGIAVFIILKRAVGRERPCALEPHCWASLVPPDRFSFPSGHSITAFAIASSLGLFYPHMFTVLLAIACSVALSRVVLGLHYMSDVVAGCLIGWGLGYLSYFAVTQGWL